MGAGALLVIVLQVWQFVCVGSVNLHPALS